MKSCSRILVFLGLWSWVWAAAGAAPASNSEVSAAVQAIQQAPDPSAAVAAYANGMAVDRADPRLNVAYVARMVDLGLPELAYHQAQTLTTVQSNNGLAWGVVAYVDARRGQMPDAISAINLAGQLAPDHPFVQRTAGEIMAWYDTRADKSKLPANAKDGLEQIRNLLNQRSAFVSAYDTARKAYQAQSSGAEQPAGTAPGAAAPTPAAPAQSQPQPQSTDQLAPLGYAQAPAPYYYSPDYYPAYYPGTYDYYYDWGPGWVQPAPWWWWQPTGFWAGFGFVPFGGIVVFDNHDDFDHHGHHPNHHDGNASHHDGQSFHGNNQAVWHHNGNGRTGFFGRPAQPNAALAQWNRDSFQRTPALSRPGRGVGTANFVNLGPTATAPASSLGPSSLSRGTARPSGSGQSTITSRGAVGPATPAAPSNRSSMAGSTPRWPGSVSPALRQSPGTSRGSVSPSLQSPANPGSRFGASPATRSWSGSSTRSFTTAPRSFGGSPSFHGGPSLSGSRMGGPIGGSSSPGGGFRGGGFGGGVSGGGGFHGGAFGGGSHGGGGSGGHR